MYPRDECDICLLGNDPMAFEQQTPTQNLSHI